MTSVRYGTWGKSPTPLIIGLAAAAIVLVGVVLFLPGGRDRSAGGSLLVEERQDRPAREVVEEVPAAEASSPRTVTTASREVSTLRPRSSTVTIRGTVTHGETGEGIPEATLKVFRPSGDRSGASPLVEAHGGGDGAFNLVLDRADYPGGIAMVQAGADGFAPVRREVSLPLGRSQTEVNFELLPAVILRGVVLNRQERPIARARVGILVGNSHPQSPMQDPYDAFPVVESDENGFFEFEAAPSGKLVMLHARHENYLPGVAEVAAPTADDPRIVLRDGEASVRGRVLDSQGRPLEGAAVETVFRQSGPGWRTTPPFPDLDTQFTRSDSEGYFEFPAVRAGWQTLVATTDQPGVQSTGNSTLLNRGEEKVVTLKFDAPLTVNGIVVDAGSGEPIQGVQIAKPNGEFSAPGLMENVDSVVTGFDGRFTVETFSQVRGGVFRVPGIHYKLPSQYAHDAADWQTHGLRFDRLNSGEEVRIEVTPTLLLEGTVFHSDLVTPAAGVGVDFRQQIARARGLQLMPDPDVANSQSQTGPDGRFKLRLPPGQRGFLLARGGDGYYSGRYDVPNEGPLEAVEIVLDAFSSISGTITGPQGEPVQGARVTLRQAAGARGTAESAESGSDGRYIIDEIYGTRGFLAVEAPEALALVAPDPRVINIGEGEHLDGQDFQLIDAAPFEGVVVDEEGNPIEGVLLSRRTGRWRNPNAPTVESDADGRFVFTDMDEDARTFTLEARHPGYDDVDMGGVNVDDTPVTVEMRARASVSLTAWQPGGDQVVSFEYQFVLERESASRDRRTNVEGRVVKQTDPVSETLSPGTYRVHVYPLSETGDRTGAYGFENFEVSQGGGTTNVRVEIGDSVTMSGRVVDGDDRGLEGVEVRMIVRDEARMGGNQWRRVEGGNRRSTTTDNRGNFKFEYTTPGTLQFEARLEGMVQAEEVEVTLEVGQRPEDVLIRMHTGASIHGVVTGTDGRPASGMTVRLGTGFRDPTETTDSSGEYEFTQLEQGRYTVVLLSETGAIVERQNVTISGENREKVDFSLEGLIQISGTINRNGSRDRNRFWQLQLIPVEGAFASRTTITSNSGRYEHFLHPGVYSVEIPVTGSSNRTVTGELVAVEERPAEQEIDINLDLVNVGIVIVDVDGDEFTPGTLTFEHRQLNRSSDGPGPWSLQMETTRSLFYLDNQPVGEARGVFVTNGGVRFTSEWTALGSDQANILTLIPENL